MRICFYTDQTISGMTGGIGRVTDVLTNHFRHDFGWQVYSIYGREAADDCVRTEVDGSVCLRLHDRLGIRRDVRLNVRMAVRFLCDNAIDVLIVQTSMDVVKKIRRAMPRDYRLKIISVLHFEPGRDEWPWQTKGIKGLLGLLRNSVMHKATVKAYRDAYKYGDRVSVLSPSYISMYRDYAGLKGNDKLFSLPNPLSFAFPPFASEKKNVALVVARLEETQKRISLILNIWSKLKNEGWQLKIVGDGPSMGMYQKLQKELPDMKSVTLCGRQDPILYYQEASLFLMTSAFEGFPMTIVEAQQFGCVPIVFDAFAALKDVVTDKKNGIVVKNNDEAEFVHQLQLLMNDEQLRKTLSEGALRDCQRYDANVISNKWKKIIEEI